MIDLIASSVDEGRSGEGLSQAELRRAKCSAFLAVLEEERAAGRCRARLIDQITREVEEQMA